MGCRGYSAVGLRGKWRGKWHREIVAIPHFYNYVRFFSVFGLEHCSTCSGVNLCLIVMERWGQLYS